MSPNTSRITIEEITEIDIVTVSSDVHPKSHILDRIISWCFYAFIVVLPLLFCIRITEPLEFSKQTFLFGATFVLASLFAVKTLIHKQITIRYSPLYIGVAALLLVWGITSLMSHYRFLSLVGLGNQEFLSLSTLLSFIILGLVAVAHFRTRNINALWIALYTSSALVSLFGLLQLLGIYIVPFESTHQTAFNTIGLFSTWGAFTVVGLVAGIVHLLSIAAFSKQLKSLIALSFFSILQLGVLILIDDWRLWLSLFVGLVFALIVIFTKLPRTHSLQGWVSIPFGAIAISILFLFITPNIVQTPLEVNPGLKASISIAWETLKSSPIVGYGPGTFRESYEHFRPVSINAVNFMNFWTVRFDQSGSLLATVIAASGILGLLGLLALWGTIKWFVGWRLIRESFSEQYLLLVGASAALVSMTIIFIVVSANISVLMLGWIIITILAILTAKTYTSFSAEQSHRFTLIAGLTLIFVLVGSGLGAYYTSVRYYAEITYAQALTLDTTLSKTTPETIADEDVDRLVSLLAIASQNNPFNDDYHRTLSQSLVYKMNHLNRKAGATGIEKEDATPLAQSALAAAHRAYALSSGDVRNVHHLAALYQTLSTFIENADKEIASYFEKAIDLEPSNPALPYEYALYHLDKAAQAEGVDANSHIDHARTLLLKAVELKSDYALPYFQLARLYARDKNLAETIRMLDTAAQHNTSLIEFNLADFNMFYTIGLAYKEVNELAKSEEMFMRILKYYPDSPAAAFQIASIRYAQGRTEEAQSIIKSLLEKDPTNEVYKKALSDLQKPSAPQTSAEPSDTNETE